MKRKLEKFDDFFINLINKKMKTKQLDGFMYKITNLGGLIFTSLLVILTIVLGKGKVRQMGFEILVTLIISQSIVYSLKMILSRERPYKIIEHLNTFGIEMKNYSFPSGHTSASFSIATIVSLNYSELAVYIFILAAVVSISRIYLGVHYPTDVLAGIILGVLTSYVVHFYLLDYIILFLSIIIST